MKWIAQLLDFGYVIFQRRLSGSRYLMGLGIKLFTLTAIGSLAFQFSNGEYSFVIDTASDSTYEIATLVGVYVSIVMIVVGFFFEVYSMLFGESASKNRAKSIDLRSLDGAAAPTLCSSFSSTIEPAGLHDDLFMWKSRKQTLEDWLKESCAKLQKFYDESLQKLNGFEPNKPLALGAIAHVPHCFTLGYLVGNKRLVNYYCWNRDNKKQHKELWLDCRDARSRGQKLECSEIMEKPEVLDSQVTKLGISIEVSFDNDLKTFFENLELDRAIAYRVESRNVGNMFSDVEQSNFVASLRTEINNTLLKKFPYVTEVHLTLMAQASLIMRIGAEFNQNHLSQQINVHHFDGAGYPWSIQINKDQEISYLIK
ncbi:SAVED domain-containing protein [Vibrio sp. A1-b2]|uniref:SAVED domain-containing protein n=1 Tax=Vibrio sp. A1-b2 TaxID=2912248 RepID=UPI001F36842F|nr:SAVED domain-containing protein [Vibrio sp. A1-b2]MCF7360849.1 SAVED domain-containing protein [Vibrio sp. A1-b2]